MTPMMRHILWAGILTFVEVLIMALALYEQARIGAPQPGQIVPEFHSVRESDEWKICKMNELTPYSLYVKYVFLNGPHRDDTFTEHIAVPHGVTCEEVKQHYCMPSIDIFEEPRKEYRVEAVAQDHDHPTSCVDVLYIMKDRR